MNLIDGWASGDVLANGVRLHYYRSGGAGMPVVLAHGITDSGECWPRVAEALAPHYDLLTYDARGHGRSETPVSPFSSGDQADDLAALVEALALDCPVAMGHSMGASTVSLAAARYPGLFRGIVLEDPPWRDMAPESSGSAVGGYRQRLLDYQAMDLDKLVAYGRERRVGWDEAEFKPWAQAKLLCRAATLEQMRPGHTEWRKTAAAIQCPTLLLTGSPEVQAAAGLGGIVTEEIAAEAGGLLRRGRVVHIPGAGHNIRREAYPAYIEVVATFLQGL